MDIGNILTGFVNIPSNNNW